MLTQWLRQTIGSGRSRGWWPRSDSRAGAASPLPPRYPPADPGLPVRAPHEIVAANADVLQRLRLHAATDAADFEARFAAPLRRLAQQVNVLPATATGHFAGEMGLFRAALEAAFYAFQAADGRIFTAMEGVERRHALEGCWRYLCFLAALLQPLGRTLERVVVTGPDGQAWKRHFAGLTDWAAQAGCERIFVSWAGSEAAEAIGPSNTSLALLPVLVGSDNLQLLDQAQGGLVAALYQLAVGAAGSAPIAHQVVSSSWERVLQREAARRPQAFGRLAVGTQQGPYLAGAMQALVQQGRWRLNASVLMADANGVYLQWPQAAADLIEFGRTRGYAGWPQDAPSLAHLLQAAGLVCEHGNDLGLLSLVDGDGEILRVLQLARPLAILEPEQAEAWQRGRAAAADHERGGARPRATAPRAAAATEPVRTADDLFATLAPAQGELEGFERTAAAAPATQDVPDTRPADASSAVAARLPSLVPADLAAAIGAPAQVQLLARIVQAWRARDAHSTVMRHIDTGAAIEFAFLATQIPDVPTWVDCMARAGLVHAPAKTPGLRVQKVVLTEGQPPVQAVVLSQLACRRLGL